MATIDEILNEFPGPVRDRLKRTWAGLPPEMRQQLEDVVGDLGPSLDLPKGLLRLVLEHYRPVFGAKQRIAIVGPANVGKSTLYNQLISREDDRAEVSAVPGTTRRNQTADTGLFVVIDTPGADAVGAVGEREQQIAFEAAGSADFLVVVFEATRGIRRPERTLFEALQELGKPYVVVLNKMDLIPRGEREQVVATAARNLDLEPSEVIEMVATKGESVGRVVLAVAKAEPELVAAMAQALPDYRARLAWQRIVAAGGAAAAVGWFPLPFADLVPLLFIQCGLVLSIARIHGYRITVSRARELITAFGIGLTARTAYQQLSKLLGAPGWILSAAIASAATVAIGYGAMMWFAYGERPTRETLQRITTDVAVYLRAQLMGLGRTRPDRTTLRRRVSQAVRELPDQLRPRLRHADEPTVQDNEESGAAE